MAGGQQKATYKTHDNFTGRDSVRAMRKAYVVGAFALVAIIAFCVGWLYAPAYSSQTQSVSATTELKPISPEDWESDPYSWQRLKCVPDTKTACDRTSCSADTANVWVELDRRASTYARCDSKGCDTYSADFNSAGAFTNIHPKSPNGTMVKVLGDRKYIEIATIGLTSLVSEGSCQ